MTNLRTPFHLPPPKLGAIGGIGGQPNKTGRLQGKIGPPVAPVAPKLGPLVPPFFGQMHVFAVVIFHANITPLK